MWGALVFGFAGMRDTGGRLSFDPRLPDAWSELTFRLRWHGHRLTLTVSVDALEISSEGEGPDVEITVRGVRHGLEAGGTLRVELDGHGERIDGTLGDAPLIGGTRADGTTITAGVPEPIPFEDHQDLSPADLPLLDPPVGG